MLSALTLLHLICTRAYGRVCHSQIPARSLAIASVTNVTLVVTKSDTYKCN